MLSFARTARRPRISHLTWRNLSTVPEFPTSDALHEEPSEIPLTWKQKTLHDLNVRKLGRTAYVRASRDFRSVVDAYAVIQAVEEKYGKIEFIGLIRVRAIGRLRSYIHPSIHARHDSVSI